MSQKKSPRGAGRHSALGRGLGALIPTQVDEVNVEESSQVDPLDVFFPARPNTTARQRGGSAKKLLVPKAQTSKKVVAASSKIQSSGVGTFESQSSSGGNEAPERAENEAHSSAKDSDLDRAKDSPKSLNASDPKQKSGRSTAQSPKDTASSNLSLSQVRDNAVQIQARGVLEEELSSTRRDEAQVQSSVRTSERVNTTPSGPQSDDALKEVSSVAGSDVSRETSNQLIPVPGASFAEIPLSYIVPNTRQPREVFDEDDLAELRDSVLEVGILQPIVVRPIDFTADMSKRLEESLEEKPEARFELIMGERRLRAAELAGLDRVPAIIRQTEDQDLLRDALLENLHRAQLNPLEEASAYQQLMADFGATQEELSKKIARSRPQIANTLRLLKLPPTVQKKVAAQVISAGHARALLSLETVEDMELLADRIVAEGLSVRTTEELVRLGRAKAAPRPRTRTRPVISALGEQVVSALQDAYETRVSITEGAKKGRIVIEFAGPEDLRRIADLISAQH